MTSCTGSHHCRECQLIQRLLFAFQAAVQHHFQSMHGVIDASNMISKGKRIEISKKASEREAANMLEALEVNHREFLEVNL